MTRPDSVPSTPPASAPRPGMGWLEPFLLLAPAGIWLALLLILPTLLIFELSLVPGIKPGDWVNPSGVENYLKILDPINLQVLGRSLFLAVATTLICLLVGFPVAYWLALGVPKRWQTILLIAFVLPLWTSSLLRSYAWITILRPTGVLNSVLTSLGLPAIQLLYQTPAVLIGMVYNLLPYLVLVLYASLEKLDRQLLEAAADLGARPHQAFCKVTIPQTLPGLVAGGLLVLITALGDFINPELLGGASSMTAARLIYNRFLGNTPDWGLGSALSTLLIAAVSLAIALLIRYGDKNAKRI